MEFVISQKQILQQLVIQLKSFFFIEDREIEMLHNVFEETINRCETTFCGSGKYFGRIPVFNPYHSVKYMIFLYTLSNELYKQYGSNVLSDKVYYLNKIMHSVDMFYEIEMPSHWGAEHPVGSVMGRAKYGDGFFFYQCCTVGGPKDEEGNIYYPVIGENVHMYANSSVLGNCKIGNNVNIGAGAIVKNQNIPDNCTVFGQSPNLIIKQNK